MSVKNAAADVLAAVSVMTHAQNACARLDPLSTDDFSARFSNAPT